MHVARGYRNLPEQTAQKFITHPEFGRLYRTGDKCKIDIKTQRVHFLGRIDAQLKVRGHRVEAQAVEDILQTQFSEIEAAVLDYQNEALVAFVSAPSICEGEISVVAPAPAEWAAQVTATLARQLPAPSVPTSIFLVEKFVMKPVSGKIDRKCLPNLSHLLRHAGPDAQDTRGDTPAGVRDTGSGKIELPDSGAGMDPECEEVLAICRSVFETPLGPDDGFTEAGGHSIAIARLAQRLQAAGWAVPVRALLGDCNTARKVAGRPRLLQQVSAAPTAPVKSQESGAGRDEAAAEVLSVGYFTTLQVLFVIFLASPGLVGFFVALAYVEIGAFFTTASLSAFILVAVGLYALGLILPFASLFWVMMIKLVMGGHIYKNNVTPGVYPKWSRMHLRFWCIAKLEGIVMLSLTIYRSAPLTAFALRQLGATVGRNLQCAKDAYLSGPLDLVSIGDDVAIQTGAYVQTARLAGQYLYVGPIHLESGCKIGMRAAIAENVTVGRGTWIAPFTPIFSDVGSHEMWEGAPARRSGRCTELRRTANTCRYTRPIWLLETANVLMQIFIFFWLNLLPGSVILWLGRSLIPAGEAELADAYFKVAPLSEIAWQLTLYAFITTWAAAVVGSLLSCLFIRWTAASPGLYPSRGLRGALLLYRLSRMNGIQGQWTWTITGQYLRALAGMRFPRVGASECDVMFNLVPEVASADSQVFWSNGCFTNMLDYGAEHIKLRRLDMPRNFFTGNNCVAEYGQFPGQLPPGRLHAGKRHRFPTADALAPRRADHRGGKPAGEICERGVRGGERNPQAARLRDFPDPGLPVRLFQHRHPAHPRGDHLHDSVRRPVAFGHRHDLQRARRFADHGNHRGPALHHDEEGARRQRMGSRSLDAFLVLAALLLLSRAGLLLRVVQGAAGVLRRDDPREPHPAMDGMSDRPPDHRDLADAVLRLERGELRRRLHDRRLPAVSHLREHDAEGQANPHPG